MCRQPFELLVGPTRLIHAMRSPGTVCARTTMQPHVQINSIRFNTKHNEIISITDGGITVYRLGQVVKKLDHYPTDCKLLEGDTSPTGGYVYVTECRPDRCVYVPILFPDTKDLLLKFESRILKTRLVEYDLLMVVQLNSIDFIDMVRPASSIRYETAPNENGLCEARMTAKNSYVVVFPSETKGRVQVAYFTPYDLKKTASPIETLKAHEHAIQCLALNSDGSLLATASTNGTVIRISKTKETKVIFELRRGSDNALVTCIEFSKDNKYLCCCSTKGTVHIFALDEQHLNRTLWVNGTSLEKISTYVVSQWSMVRLRVAEKSNYPLLCAFGTNVDQNQEGLIYFLDSSGAFSSFTFNKEGIVGEQRIVFDFNVSSPLEPDSSKIHEKRRQLQ